MISITILSVMGNLAKLNIFYNFILLSVINIECWSKTTNKLECGPMPNVMVALPNTRGALCSTPQSG